MAFKGHKHDIKANYLAASSGNIFLTSQHKDLTSRHNYLTCDGNNII